MTKRKSKQHPLSIEILGDREYSGDILVYYSKGHQDKESFVKEIVKEYDEVINPDDVKHCYGYKVMIDTEDGVFEKGQTTTKFIEKIKPGKEKGKFPATMVDMELITK